jgi:hypothetical protein
MAYLRVECKEISYGYETRKQIYFTIPDYCIYSKKCGALTRNNRLLLDFMVDSRIHIGFFCFMNMKRLGKICRPEDNFSAGNPPVYPDV